MKKKILALILAAVICLGLLSISASAANVGETHTVTFDVMWRLTPGDIIGSIPAPITVTNGDKWNLTRPIWFTAVGEIDWYTENFERVTKNDIVNLDSDITLYACPVEMAESNRPAASQKPAITKNPVASSTDKTSVSAANVGETHTVTFNMSGTSGSFKAFHFVTITVTNGDKWDLPDVTDGSDEDPAILEACRGLYAWYTCSYDRVYNGTVIDLDSDIMLYSLSASYGDATKAYNDAHPENKFLPLCHDKNHDSLHVKGQTGSIVTVTGGSTHTVTFNAEHFDIPGDLLGPIPTPVTVTNGDKWDLPQPMWFTSTDTRIGWYTIDLYPINNGDIINLDSDITVYACPVNYAIMRRAELDANSDGNKIAATASSWAQADVAEAFKAGLIPENRACFGANCLGGNITRVNFCELIAELIEAKTGMDATAYAESLGKTVGGHFLDSTGYPAIEAAYALGIVNGVSENTFGAGKNITRQEAAAMLERAAEVLGISSSSTGMTFNDGIADWAKGSVSFVSGLVDPVSGNAVMGGVGNGCFDPTGKYTVEQAIVTVLRLYHCA